MSLILSTDETKKTKSQELLDSYLEKACRRLNNIPAGEIRKTSKNFVQNFAVWNGKEANEELLTGIKKEDIKKKEKELKNEAKRVSSRIKVNYALNAELNKDKPISPLGLSMAALPGALFALGSMGHEKPEGVAIGLAGIGAAIGAVIAVKKLQQKFEAKTTEEQWQGKSYMKIKHSQWALKQLKKQIQKEKHKEYKHQVQQLFAAGLGNPGGMITPLNLQQKKSGGR